MMKKITSLLFLGVLASSLFAQQYEATEKSRFTLLSCTSGPDLYSIFGHTAIRFEDEINGNMVDIVYNYGTFEFSDDFYWKFAQGKLDYKLSMDDFSSFQQEYIYTGRGIYEQELLLSLAEKKELFRLLQENYKPENRVYRYDFFYDNCATRVRDIIVKAVDRPVSFTYEYDRAYTFRQAIQRYLDHMPWSDFGIDLALGIPCDRKMEKGQAMFLPDSLMLEFNYATAGDGALVSPAVEMLPAEYELGDDSLYTPMNVFGFFLILQIFFGWWKSKSGKLNTPLDRLLLFITGLVGVMVVFLWFFTDHTATKWNLNLLWANPVYLIFAFISWNKKWVKQTFMVLTIIDLFLVVCWFFLPQSFHLATLPIVIGLIYIGLRQWRPGFFIQPSLGTKSKTL